MHSDLIAGACCKIVITQPPLDISKFMLNNFFFSPINFKFFFNLYCDHYLVSVLSISLTNFDPFVGCIFNVLGHYLAHM